MGHEPFSNVTRYFPLPEREISEILGRFSRRQSLERRRLQDRGPRPLQAGLRRGQGERRQTFRIHREGGPEGRRPGEGEAGGAAENRRVNHEETE